MILKIVFTTDKYVSYLLEQEYFIKIIIIKKLNYIASILINPKHLLKDYFIIIILTKKYYFKLYFRLIKVSMNLQFIRKFIC